REDQATRHVSVVRAEVLVEGFPADVELAGKLRLGLAGRRSLPQAATLRQRATAGEPKAQLAREFNISRETLYQYLRTDD
ncbi:helix-turn-helix domain-containing protein, partial [Serratia marcescens]